MKFAIEVRLKGYCEEDIEEIQKIIMGTLYKKYVVIKESSMRPNDDQPGFHKFVTLKEMPKNLLTGLGDSGREI